jgi:N-acetylglucosaminyldiphosphoundecaprenol N-acetyl-beta-D-mannosaminyltransferase
MQDGARLPAWILGVRVDHLRRPDLLERVVQSVRRRVHVTFLYVNVHCMNVQSRDPQYAGILRDADIVYCDGMGVLLAARLTGQTIPERMTGADWIEDLCQVMMHHDLSLYLLGSSPQTVHGAAAALQARYPGLRIVGAGDGYAMGPETVAQINAAHPDILLVGMGTPRQEKWIARHRGELDVPVVWAVGALFDFVSGRIPRGPRWMTQHGLEWLCRLVIEPRRLWRRYLLGNPRFLWRVLVPHSTANLSDQPQWLRTDPALPAGHRRSRPRHRPGQAG